MNYVLTINLEGADDAEKSIDNLLKKVGGISSTPKISFSDWLDYGDAPEKAGEKIGDSITKGATKNLMSFNILDAWGKAKLKGLKDFWNDALKVGSKGGTIKGLRDVTGRDLSKVQSLPDINSLGDKNHTKDLIVGAITTLFNPFVGTRMMADTLKEKHGASAIEKGLFGPGGAMKAGELFLVVESAKLALKLFIASLKLAVEWIGRAISNAHELYAKALTMGLSLQLTAQRSMTANVLGVPEDQVMRFKQSAYVMQRLSDSINEISKDAPQLAFVSVQFKILEYDALALASKLATNLAPEIIGVTIALDGLIKKIASLAEIAILIGKAGGQALFGRTAIDFLTALGTAIQGTGQVAAGKAGFNSPLAMMKQLPASSWEKMGLITMGGNQNYAKDTAKNTRDTVKAINRLAKYADVSKSKPTWGMSPNTAQP